MLLVTGICLALIAGLPVATAAGAFTSIFTTGKTVQIIIAIILVGVLGNLLKQYGFLDKIVAALETLIPNKKAILMVLPAVMGILTVPGGAYLSAPFVDKIGDELELVRATEGGSEPVFPACSAFCHAIYYQHAVYPHSGAGG